MPSFQVKTYQVMLMRDNPVEPGHHAAIQCTGASTQERFTIWFYPAGFQPQNNTVVGTVGTSHRPATEYVWYIDLLRNESPVTALLNVANPQYNRLWCSEPVGEGEGFF